jgi:ribosome-associated translation inhibitor RaiA
MQEEAPKADKQTVEDRKRKREHLIELGMQAYDELRRISSSEQAAREAEFRLAAFTVMARMGNFNAAIIRDQEAEDLLQFIDEIEEGYTKMEEELEKLKEERQQRHEVEEARSHAPGL